MAVAFLWDNCLSIRGFRTRIHRWDDQRTKSGVWSVKEGDVILTQIPQSDGTMKTRPALVLRELPPFRDLLVCGISTQTHQAVRGFDELMLRADSDFSDSGLIADSVVRLGFLAVLPRSKVAGTI